MIPEESVEVAAQEFAKSNADDSVLWDRQPEEFRDWCRWHALKILEAAVPNLLADAWDEGHEVGWDDRRGERVIDNPYRSQS